MCRDLEGLYVKRGRISIVKTVSSGDGTGICTFEHLCAIEFSMPMNAVTVSAGDVQNPGVLP